MSYAFDMSFAMAADEKEAFVLARHYVEKCMEKKNARKFIEDNTIYIPSIRYSHVEKANNMAEVADRYWLETLFKFRFLYWPKYRLLGLVGSNRIDDPAFPMSIYFQNSTDQNYDFQEWLEGKILFFKEYVERIQNIPFVRLMDTCRDYLDEDTDLSNPEIELYMRQSLLYNRIFSALELKSWLYADGSEKDVSYIQFALSGIQDMYEVSALYTMLKSVKKTMDLSDDDASNN